MRKLSQRPGIVLLLILVGFNSCKTNTESSIPGMALLSLTSVNVSLLTSSGDTVRNVSTTSNIVATFSNDIDFNTITSTTVTIMRDTIKLDLNFIIEGKTLTIDPVNDLLSGAELTISFKADSIQSTGGASFVSGKNINFFTLGVGVDTPPQKDHQILYLQFNNSVADLTLHDTITYAYLSYGTDRYGIANQAGYFAGTSATMTSGNIVELEPNPRTNPTGTVIPPSMTISLWVNVPNLAYRDTTTGLAKGVFGVAGERGYYFEIAGGSVMGTLSGPEMINVSTDHSLMGGGYYNSVQTVSGLDETSTFVDVNYIIADGWHQIVITYDQATSVKVLYVDGKLIRSWPLSDPNTGLPLGPLALNKTGTTPYDPNIGAGFDGQLILGYYSSKENTTSKYFQYQTAPNTFIGLMDDFRMFDIAFTTAEVQKLYMQESVQ